MGMEFRSTYFRAPAGFNPVPFLRLCLKHWYLFALSVVGCGVLAWYAVRTVPPKYNVNASLKVNRQFDFPNYGAENRLNGLRLYSGLANIYTYIGEVNSRSVLLQSMYDLGYDVKYYRSGRETVKRLPYRIELDRTHPQLVDLAFRIEPLEDGRYHVTSKAQDVFIFDYAVFDHDRKNGVQFALDETVAPGEWIDHPWCRFAITPLDTAGTKPVKTVRFPNPSVEVGRYMQQLRVKTLNKGASIITLAITTDQRHKDIALVNRMMERYAGANRVGKRQLAQNTHDFLELRIDSTRAELFRIEAAITAFKEREGWLDLDAHAAQVNGEAGRLQQTLDEQLTQLEYLEFVRGQALASAALDTVFAPSMANLPENGLVDLINQAAALQREAAEMRIYAGPQNPGLLRNRRMHAWVQDQIHATLDALVMRAKNDVAYTRSRLGRTQQQVFELPAAEREWLHLSRQRDRLLAGLKRLRKKEGQVASALAADIPDVEVLEPAFVKGNKAVAPLSALAYAILIVIGLFVPFLGLMLWGMLRPTVATSEQLQSACDAPVLLEHPQIRKKSARTWDGSPTRVGEALVALAETHLNANTQSQSCVLFTPCGKRVGMTTVLRNLAFGLMRAGKRTVILTATPPTALSPTGRTLEDWVAQGADHAPGTEHQGVTWLVSHTGLSADLAADWSEIRAHLHVYFDEILLEGPLPETGVQHPGWAMCDRRVSVARLERSSEEAVDQLQRSLETTSIPTVLLVNGVLTEAVWWKRRSWRAHYPLNRSLPERGWQRLTGLVRKRRLRRSWS